MCRAITVSSEQSKYLCEFLCSCIVGLEFTRREIVAKIHIGEATLAKRVTEFASTAAGELTLEEFDQRGRALETEQMALLENTQPSEEQAAPGCRCIHIGASYLALPSSQLLWCHADLTVTILVSGSILMMTDIVEKCLCRCQSAT